MTAWSTTAVNLPEHADNPIHTDAGAQAAGFPAALVAGVTVYACLSHLPVAAWGTDWLQSGGAAVRFVQPVMDRAQIDCVPVDGDDGPVVEARVGGSVAVRCVLRPPGTSTTPVSGRSGERLQPVEFVADASWSDYGARAGDDLDIYAHGRLLHPSTWLRIANGFFADQLVSGPWIHVRSDVVHRGLARIGDTITAEAVVVDRFDSRAGRRAVAEVTIAADGRPVADIEHEAIIEVA